VVDWIDFAQAADKSQRFCEYDNNLSVPGNAAHFVNF
jgi:hypothetical protein